jgi:hypothetical protein
MIRNQWRRVFCRWGQNTAIHAGDQPDAYDHSRSRAGVDSDRVPHFVLTVPAMDAIRALAAPMPLPAIPKSAPTTLPTTALSPALVPIVQRAQSVVCPTHE